MSTVTFRRERPDDVPVVDLVRAAFGTDGDLLARLVTALRASHAWRDLSFVAQAGGAVVGHVLLTGSRLDTPPRPHDPSRSASARRRSGSR